MENCPSIIENQASTIENNPSTIERPKTTRGTHHTPIQHRESHIHKVCIISYLTLLRHI